MIRFGAFLAVLSLTFATTIAHNATTGRVECIFSSMAAGRAGEYSLRIEDIPVDYCTHVIYDHIMMDGDIIMPSNGEYDHVQDGWRKFVDLKKRNPKVKLLLSYQSPLTSLAIVTAKQREDFVATIVWFLSGTQMDGISIVWFGYKTSDGAEEGTIYSLIDELHQGFAAAGHPDWEVNVMMHMDQPGLFDGVDHARMCKLADSVSLFGMFIDDDERTTSFSPLHGGEAEPPNVSIQHELQKWLNRGCPASKIVLGLPFMGRVFTLSDPTVNGLNAPITGPGKPCPVTDGRGFCGYFELCQMFNQTEWTFKWDAVGVSPYAFHGDQWVGYENVASIEQKARFARAQGFAGVFGLNLAQDDYVGQCGERFALAKALWRGFLAH